MLVLDILSTIKKNKHMKNLIFFLGLLLLSSCSLGQKSSNNREKNNFVLEFLYSTPNLLKTPESVQFYPVNNTFFVSNINGNPSDLDSNGFISIVDEKAKIINLEWISGLNAPKGMGIFNDFLYVTDINRIVKIDIKNSKIAEFYEIPNAKFLNDITIDNSGNIYISDMGDNKIYTINNNKISVFIDSNLKSPNGLLFSNNKLYIGNKNYILEYNLVNNSQKIICENTGSIDGLKFIDKTDFIISDWSGNINSIKSNCDKNLLLSTENEKVNAADFEYVQNKKLLLVPTFFDNRVTFYRLKSTKK